MSTYSRLAEDFPEIEFFDRFGEGLAERVDTDSRVVGAMAAFDTGVQEEGYDSIRAQSDLSVAATELSLQLVENYKRSDQRIDHEVVVLMRELQELEILTALTFTEGTKQSGLDSARTEAEVDARIALSADVDAKELIDDYQSTLNE